MKTIRDALVLTQFDCYCCLPIIKCATVGCVCDYECGEYCPKSMSENCSHVGKPCRPVLFSLIAEDMILKGEY